MRYTYFVWDTTSNISPYFSQCNVNLPPQTIVRMNHEQAVYSTSIVNKNSMGSPYFDIIDALKQFLSTHKIWKPFLNRVMSLRRDDFIGQVFLSFWQSYSFRRL